MFLVLVDGSRTRLIRGGFISAIEFAASLAKDVKGQRAIRVIRA